MNPVKRNRCGVCKASLAIMSYTCRCEKRFCINHLPATEHLCTHNYRNEGHEQLSRQLDVSGLAVKVDKI